MGLFHSFCSSSSIDLLFPPSCPACRSVTDGNRGGLCENCFALLKFISSPYCTCCGRAFPSATVNHLCGDCLQSCWSFDRARSLFSYEDVIAGLIHRLKYSGSLTGLGTFRYLWQASPVVHDLDEPDMILPVPLHLKRLRKRGFNQALVLARALFPEQRKQLRYDILIRETNTPPQTGLSGKERRKNLKNVFVVKNAAAVEGKKILLLDDVFTTGTTVDECARSLKKAGCRRVEVVTMCRSDRIV